MISGTGHSSGASPCPAGRWPCGLGEEGDDVAGQGGLPTATTFSPLRTAWWRRRCPSRAEGAGGHPVLGEAPEAQKQPRRNPVVPVNFVDYYFCRIPNFGRQKSLFLYSLLFSTLFVVTCRHLCRHLSSPVVTCRHPARLGPSIGPRVRPLVSLDRRPRAARTTPRFESATLSHRLFEPEWAWPATPGKEWPSR